MNGNAQWWIASIGDTLIWARLTVTDSGVAEVFDSDGRTLRYDGETEARMALLDAEFRAFDGLDEEDAAMLGFDLDEIGECAAWIVGDREHRSSSPGAAPRRPTDRTRAPRTSGGVCREGEQADPGLEQRLRPELGIAPLDHARVVEVGDGADDAARRAVGDRGVDVARRSLEPTGDGGDHLRDRLRPVADLLGGEHGAHACRR